MLFLGSGGSGKSTILKQLKTIHGDGFSVSYKIDCKTHIHIQIIEDMILCIKGIEILKEENEEYETLQLTEKGEMASILILESEIREINASVAQYIKTLWNDPAIRTVYDMRAITGIADSTCYFFANQILFSL